MDFARSAPDQGRRLTLGSLSTGEFVGSLAGPLAGGVLADLTGSYRIPFYCISATVLMSTGLVWVTVHERFVPAAQARARRAVLSSLIFGVI